MSVPRLTEVFRLLPEANVTSLAQMNKIPLNVAQKINDFDRQLAPQLASIFSARFGHGYKYDVQRLGEKIASEALEDYVDTFLGVNGTAWAFKKAVKNNPKEKQSFVDLAKTNWRDFRQKIFSIAYRGEKEQIATKQSVMKFPDGFVWSKLNNDQWEEIGKEMQHCGRPVSSDSELYQLFDPSSNGHVTIEMDSKNTGMSGEPVILQIKGKQNDFPDRKYWDYVRQFIGQFKASNSETLTPDEFRHGKN